LQAYFIRSLLNSTTKILVIRFSSIGDIVLTTPVIRLLHQLEGKVEVHFLTRKKFDFLLEANPYIHKIHTIESSVQEILPELSKINFDYIIDLHHNIRTRIVKRRLKSLAFTFRKLNIKKWLWVNFGMNLMPKLHVVDRYLETLNAFQVQDDGKGLDYFIPAGKGLTEEHRDWVSTPYIALVIGGVHSGKKMGRVKLNGLCMALPHKVILLGGPEEVEDANYIESRSGGNVVNAVGKLSLHQSADILRQSELVVTGDTGLMHIASAFGKKIISLWGCTVPGFGMSPYKPHPKNVILEPFGRKRRPCSKLGNRCKYPSELKCIEKIVDDEILKSIEKLWAPQKGL
jgi:ADP-heptose:LPS heptosyltransferase